MDNASSVSCPSCGAAADVSDAVCDLCGTPLPQPESREEAMASTEASPVTASPMPLAESSVGPFCHQCGTRNPIGARFCTACGTAIHTSAPDTKPASSGRRQKASSARPAPSSTVAPESAPPIRPAGLQAAILLTSAVLVVVALFLITQVSKTRLPVEQEVAAETRSSANGTDAQQAAQQAAAPLAGDLAEQVARIEDEMGGLEGAALRAKQDELIALYSQAGRLDRVATLREEIAGGANTAEAWKEAGNALYELMEATPGDQRPDIAQRAADAYDRALSLGEDDLVVRTAMAMAYMNTRAPMQGVMQIRQVLETDPDHLEGNFYYGVMLMQINRLDQALGQFEKVKTLVGPEQPLYRQADMMIANIKTLGGNANS
ncbi:MAG: zinc ribbon domain-containing protein [Rhodothermales bacterium]|nr:zinc ribbon domain-containing protein [Rhodothermales bacterium]